MTTGHMTTLVGADLYGAVGRSPRRRVSVGRSPLPSTVGLMLEE